jgi:tetratricopeptide (TPR) repeat protein
MVLSASVGDDPVSKFLHAHAALSQNQNNESLCLFEALTEPVSLSAWDKWTEGFMARFPASPISLYLRADSLARRGSWEKAGELFDKAIATAPDNPLILNARGSAFAARRMWDPAVVDFAAAVAISPTFADALANRGLIYILQNNPGQWAETWLTRALDSSKNFAIALNARGAVRVARGDLDGAEQDFNRARTSCDCMALAVDNLLSVDILRIGVQESILQKVLGATTPGTELSTTNQLQTLSAIRGQLQTAQAQLRVPSDAGLQNLGANLNQANIEQAAAAVRLPLPVVNFQGKGLSSQDVLNQAYGIGYQIGTALRSDLGLMTGDPRALITTDQARVNASNQIAAIEQANFNSVLTNMRNFPNGAAAQQWGKLGYTAQNLTLDTFRNPPPAQGGVAMSGTHIDTGHWPVVVWLGIWYPPVADTK